MNGHRGFTLLELLIGMTLLGFILALLFAGFRLASDSWDAVDRRTLRTTDEQMGRALVRRLLTNLQPVRWKKAVNQPLAFAGASAGFRAIAPLAGPGGTGGLRVVELTAGTESVAGKEAARLILRQAPVRYDAEDFAAALTEAKEHTILGDLAAVQFAYFGPPKKGEPAAWQDAWQNPEQLPQLVRVHLESRDGGWADLIVAPVVNGTGCRWNAFYKRCMY